MDFAARSTDSAGTARGSSTPPKGGLVAWRGCSPDAAFVEIVHTAKRHNVGAMTMADDLAQIARTPPGAVKQTVGAASGARALLRRPTTGVSWVIRKSVSSAAPATNAALVRTP